MSNNLAPVCPVSFGQPTPDIQRLRHTVNSIPRANDLKSAITALNIIANVISQINRGQPVINNIGGGGGGSNLPGTNLNGTDNNPHYTKADWIEEYRHYDKRKLYNYDDQSQFIEINVLTEVVFTNKNTNYTFKYNGAE
jgi:hypothetical protein